MLYPILLLQLILIVLAGLGGAYLVRLYITGTLRALPTYTAGEVRDAGWTRPRVAHDAAKSLLPAPVAAGSLEIYNMSTHPTTVSDLHLLILTPLHNSVADLPRLFSHLDAFNHSKSKTSLGFLVGDEDDRTGTELRALADARRNEYRQITVISQNLNIKLPVGPMRHLRSVQLIRRWVLAHGGQNVPSSR